MTGVLPDTTAPVASLTLPAPWSLEAEAVEQALGVGRGGLDNAEVNRRRASYGTNELASRERVSAVAVFLHQFRSPLIYILFAALALTVLLQEHLDSLAIALVLVVNATVGFLQEYRAERALEALQRLTPLRTTAVRGGHEVTIAARELVPGDIVVLEAGARIPADVRLTHAAAVEANESLLTGESVSVSKSMSAVPIGAAVADRASMLLAGTTVSRGRARGVVTATGPATELGQLAAALHRAESPPTPLQLRVARLARQIAISVAGVGVVGVSAGLLHGQMITDLLLTMAALAVSAVPEGLPIVLTVTLAVGVRRMAAQRAVVRRLPAVETLGSCTVIGTDKTGTLTQNQMTVVEIETGGTRYDVTGGGYASGEIRLDGTAVDLGRHPLLHAVLAAGALCNEASIVRSDDGFEPYGDPTEAALLVAAAKGGLERHDLERIWPRVAERPFDPAMAFAATYHKDGAQTRLFVKGAPERVVQLCGSAAGGAPVDRDQVLARADALAAAGRRVLAVAMGRLPGPVPPDAEEAIPADLEFLGMLAMIDPPRPEVFGAITECQRAGIRVIMITGDHAATAAAIARETGIAGAERPPLTGVEMDELDDEALSERLKTTAVCARTSPEHKLRIVHALQGQGQIVAVTGDGANDAPALAAASIGIAMGASGTDIARESADIVITDDNFTSIVAALREGRIAFDNLRKATVYLVATAIAEVAVVLVSLVLGTRLVFLPAQLLWMNVVSEGVDDVALAFEPAERGVTRRPPHPPGQPVMARRQWERAAVAAVTMAGVVLAIFFFELRGGASDERARSAAMVSMVLMQALYIGSARSEGQPIWRINPLRNPYLLVAAVSGVLLQVLVMQWQPTRTLLRVEPLDLATWTGIAVASLLLLLVVEAYKQWQGRARPDQRGLEEVSR